jgi:hypothetical protein
MIRFLAGSNVSSVGELYANAFGSRKAASRSLKYLKTLESRSGAVHAEPERLAGAVAATLE